METVGLFSFENSRLAYMAADATKDLQTRLIPLLPEIDASCGLALRCPFDAVEVVKAYLSHEHITWQGVYSYVRRDGKRYVEALV
ncbi:DUF3343 domain-containing protein [Peptoniphilus equinus]|uniref:DUF3343 domain-containing protein n=1 Tax=Peptoniphilus equinus TaxID=3016343 RepID=A0ABY7QUY7_9FIRM|nr:putative Se/S carrier-like protein [Peptoniphilus equinus]WBW50589.1 DUF3343 domain-containing protein [Peptoniphilus equinus]